MTRKRLILKKWYNSIDVLKITGKVEVRAENIGGMVEKKKFFNQWKDKFAGRVAFKKGVRELKIKNFKNFLAKHFKPWLNLTEGRSANKFKFIRKRVQKLQRTAFDQFKLYHKAAQKENKKIEGIVRLRATNLLQKAFYEGLIVYRNQMRIKNKMSQAAGLFMAENYLTRGFQALI